MRRRSMLKAAASFALLAAPRLAKAGSHTTLRFVPVSGLVILDPVAATGRPTRVHGFLVFDTLYGLDETLNPQPQMVAGHTIEDDGRRWTLTLRDQLRFHDGEKARGRDVVASIRRFGARNGLGQSLMAATDECVRSRPMASSPRLRRSAAPAWLWTGRGTSTSARPPPM